MTAGGGIRGEERVVALGRIHFLVVATEWNSAHGGLSTFNRQLCTHLAAAGVRVSCLVATASEAERHDAAAKGVRLVAAARTGGSPDLSRKPDLGDSGDPDVIVGHARVTGPAAQRLADDFPAAKRLHFVHMIPDEIEWHKLRQGQDIGRLAEERQQIELDLSQDADYAVAVGPRIHAWFLRDLEARGVDPRRVLRFDPGFDAPPAGPRPAPSGSPWTVLLFGRAEDDRLKGLDLAALGFSAVATRRHAHLPRIELLIRGAQEGTSRELERQMVEWAKDRTLNVRVKPYAGSDRLATDLRAASLVLMPSRAEGFGLVGVEAIVARTPVLVSGESGLGDLLREVLPPEQAARNVVETTGDDVATADTWSRAIEAMLRDRDGAFAWAGELQRVLADERTWAGSVAKLLTDIGAAGEPGPRETGEPVAAAGSADVTRLTWGFTGREDLLERVGLALSAVPPTPVVLHGPGGVGKSWVSLEYAYRARADYDLVEVVNAENPELIAGQLAEIGARLGIATAMQDVVNAARATVAALRERGRWLLVFDNAEQADDLTPWLPGGAGHVLVTSRAGRWRNVARPIPMEEFTRPESVALLTNAVGGLTDAEADRLAETLGDLPLALAQVAGVLDDGLPAAEFQRMIDAQAAHILDQGVSPDYGNSLAAVTQIAADRLAGISPVAAHLLSLCSYLAPEPIVATWLTQAATGAADLPADGLAASQAFALIRDRGLGRVDVNGLRLHRLTQAILRDRTREREGTFRELAASLLTAAAPEDTDSPVHWPDWAHLVPHLLITIPHATTHEELRHTACRLARYLIVSGQVETAVTLTDQLHRDWETRLGVDHLDTLTAAQHRAHAYRDHGDFTTSYAIGLDTYNRRSRILGEEHPDTLMSANNLAANLGALGRDEEALLLNQEVYERCQWILGEDHFDTLLSANNLADNLYARGRYKEALPLAEEVHERACRLLSEDHPDALVSASIRASVLNGLGRYEEATELDRRAHAQRRRVLGEDHPKTLDSARNLACNLHPLGRHKEALALAQQAYDRRRRTVGEDHPDTLATAGILATVLHALGRRKEALSLARKTHEGTRLLLGEGHPLTLTSASSLSSILHSLGRHQEALDLNQHACEGRGRILGEDHPSTLNSAHNQVGILLALGRRREALDLARDVYERRRRVLGEDHPQTHASARNLATVYQAMGNTAAALRIKSRLPKKRRK
ncbi:tetratricopeptide repeat protein [Nonomuraea sp. NN258]|uniref:FxSxx-COOH system tetratricopeptide repeat protein n=1 Tax=Nonomuraea antri TaxID=2730852 RepID=UPI001568ED46|nr:FxSxx-COOH system tetratricopeptide repeat protein [Nonomuraea antri]NRQ36237.1 tetratricopeptide repeat protein [Nonomuraea antri]